MVPDTDEEGSSQTRTENLLNGEDDEDIVF